MVVESDPAVVSDLRAVVSDSDRSVLPVAGFEFPAVFLGKVAFDAVGLGAGPPCFRVDSLLKRMDTYNTQSIKTNYTSPVYIYLG